jgi:ligand-binding sensor domain-containing protein
VKAWYAAAAALVFFARPVAAETLPAPRVVAVIGATSDAYEAAVVDGDPWIATSGGLVIVKNDRVARVLTSLDGLYGSRLRSISVLTEGAYLGGVDGAALVRKDDGGEVRVVRTFAVPRIRRVARFGGVRYAASFGAGLVRLDDDGRMTPVPSVPVTAQVTDILPDGDRLYVATARSGVLRLDRGLHVERTFRASKGLLDDAVWQLVRGDEKILVATGRGISAIEGDRVSEVVRDLPVSDVRAVAFSRGEVYAATFGGGAFRVGKERAALGRGRSARSVLPVTGGALVLHPDGVDRIDASGHRAALVSGGLPSADLSALARDAGGLWVGTFDRGLARLTRDGVAPVGAGVDPRVNDVAVLDGTLYVATDGGLFAGGTRVVDPGAPPREHTSALYVDPRTSDLWVAGARTLARRHAGGWTRWRADDVPAISQLDAVVTDDAGGVWAGGIHGLVRFDPARGAAEVTRASSGALAVDWVTALLPWRGAVAAGTYNGGLAFFAGTPKREEEKDGLPAGWINPRAMARVRGELWLGALDRGLVYGAPGAWRRLGLADHLPSADVTAIVEDGDHAAWVATRGGLARVEF